MRGNKGSAEARERTKRPDEGIALDDLGLARVCLPLHAAESLEDCLDLCLRQLEQVIDYDAASIAFVEGSSLVAAASRGLDSMDQRPPPSVALLLDHPLFAQMVSSRQPEWGASDGADQPWLMLPGSVPIQSWMAMPLLVKDMPIGQLAVGSSASGAYTPEDGQRLAIYAGHAAAALRHSRLLEEERLRSTLLEAQSGYLRKLLEALRDLSADLNPSQLSRKLLDWAMETVPDTEGGCLFVREGEELQCRAVAGRVGEEVLGLVLPVERLRSSCQESPVVRLTGHPVNEVLRLHDKRLLGHGRARATTLIAFICLGQDQLLGALCLGNWSAPDAFGPTAVELARLFAAQAAVVISNARLYRVVREYTATLEARVSERTAQIREAKERSETILHSVADGVVVTDLDGNIVEANPVADAWLRFRAGDREVPNARLYAFIRQIATQQLTQGPSMVDFASWPQPASAPGSASGGCARLATMTLRGEEPLCWLDDSGYPASERCATCGYASSLSRTYLQAHAAPIAQDDEPPTGLVIVLRDISKMRELDDLKSQFVSNVSHELRTPLSNIKLYLSLIARGRSDKREHYLRIMDEETNRLSKLIEDLLALSRLETGQVEVAREALRWDDVVHQVLETYRPQIEVKHMRVRTRLAPDAPPIWACRDQLVQVLTNLFSNAINYTKPRGEIWIETAPGAADHAGYTLLSVRDTGIGIAEADQERIFERFYRGMAEELGIPGTGLGLTIVKEIVESYGGHISVRSQLGVGSAFTVYLPSCPQSIEPHTQEESCAAC